MIHLFVSVNADVRQTFSRCSYIMFFCSRSRCRHIGKGKNNEETECRSLQKAPLLSSYEKGKKNSRTLAVLTSARTVHNGLFRTADYTSGYKTDPACGTEPGLSLRVRFFLVPNQWWALRNQCFQSPENLHQDLDKKQI